MSITWSLRRSPRDRDALALGHIYRRRRIRSDHSQRHAARIDRGARDCRRDTGALSVRLSIRACLSGHFGCQDWCAAATPRIDVLGLGIGWGIYSDSCDGAYAGRDGRALALASQFWFLAFALATAASVRTLALVEVLFA